MLLSAKSDETDGLRQGKISKTSLQRILIHLIDEDECPRFSIKGNNDYSFSSSMTDDGRNGSKAHGVVARLMTFDSLPSSSNSDSYSATFFDTQSLGGAHSDRGIRGFHNEAKIVYYNNRPVKLLSPINSFELISEKSTAYIIEATTRIIDQGPQTSRKGKIPSARLRCSSVPLRVRDLKDKKNGTIRYVNDAIKEGAGVSIFCKRSTVENEKELLTGMMEIQLLATYGDPECIIVTEVESFEQIGLQIDPD
ncbi:hypothetical protein GIB67_029433 [Kingdonia uniflora]|uniref:DUF3741 domain-containing protein n=1 Tax=Kingdonia uniflora TaxID=39325 RepID=A0A7J7NXV1_9MAGN|nr:hypothetical protein GIB67_029433 [Kingdonia uniflora]